MIDVRDALDFNFISEARKELFDRDLEIHFVVALVKLLGIDCKHPYVHIPLLPMEAARLANAPIEKQTEAILRAAKLWKDS
jgi:hypothetical protein